ncbi:preprotein translocase subunit SecE [Candidatus Peregrinibacteria bacterium RIFOXYC2_FULL_33_13]|nr:MAG: Protein translocase subunit [Candidatus Peregrinibacteria bacterium GW2011_GWA2_33_10]KKP41196.1 MAG: hypothetical protein UR30_C0001G0043 [Candidatus Peregrinibacteria bacterium GW2011_GWC2_33_13]OGJ50843.1 MAG: preprotein translocase subunit SecE [Candidatus Peregrinibacteria bacterium RIFOXYA2_FULL_33_7]OGJ55337.1 MAG: preprotein translocase subunit SecE [Candidatus Peregrinibacteria bacterium RIFOXYC2_FULL_33_13]
MKNNVLVEYFKGSVSELRKVSWPTKNQAIKLTAIVLGFSLIFSFFLAGVDFGLSEAYKLALEKLK